MQNKITTEDALTELDRLTTLLEEKVSSRDSKALAQMIGLLSRICQDQQQEIESLKKQVKLLSNEVI